MKALARYGSALVEAGDGSAGVAMLRRAVDRSPSLVAAWHNLALATANLGWLDVSATAYEHLLKQQPRLPGEWVKYGYVAMQLERYADADHAFRKAAELAPDTAEPLMAEASLEYADFHYDRALALLQEALKASPQSGAIYGNIASILMEQKKTTEAEQAARKAVKLDPSKASYRVALAKLLSTSRDAAKRHEAETMLAPLVPEQNRKEQDAALTAEAHTILASMAWREQRRKEAIDQWRAALSANANDIEALLGLGHALATDPASRAESATLLDRYQSIQSARDRITKLKQQVETHPTDAATRARYGAELLSANILPSAVWQLREAVRLQPSDRSARANLVKALEAQNRPDDAVRVVRGLGVN
jgi:tetratricopeptide (TPR) repeat protein